MMQSNKLKRSSSSNQDPTAAALRAELEQELQSKKQCSYGSYECTQLTLKGYNYCSKHILSDRNAPFKQCGYVYQTNGKRCNLPAPKGEKKEYGYCNEHALKSMLVRNRQNSKYPPPQTAEVFLNSLSHYVKRPKNRTSQISDESGRRSPEETGEIKATRSLDPFCDLDANLVFSNRCNEILDLCSESESDVEPSTFSSVWHDANADSSDNESIDSEQEDPLKHANVYTAEEVTLVTRDKLIRLQSLYIEQYRHLQHMLRERRRKYIHALKREKETCCNIYHQVRDNPKEQRLYKKLKQYNKYHRTYGEDAILNKRFHNLREKTSDGTPQKSLTYTKCSFTEGGVKCGEKALPVAKHCRKHILEDPNQVLFKACGKVTCDVQCTTPVEAIFDDSTCKLHMEVPPLRSYSNPRKESESDKDDILDMPAHYTFSSDSVKTELLHYGIPPEIPKMETLPSMLFEDDNSNSGRATEDSENDFQGDFGGLDAPPSTETQMEVDETDKPVENLKNDDNVQEEDIIGKENVKEESNETVCSSVEPQVKEEGDGKLGEISEDKTGGNPTVTEEEIKN